MKFSFKKEPRETGLASVGNPHPSTVIKLEKKQVGTIIAPNWQTEDGLWGVNLMIKNDSSLGWKWMRLKKRFESEPEARTYLKNNFERIKSYGLHQMDTD